MAKHEAGVSPTRQGREDNDRTLFPGQFVSWDEITSDEVAAFESALDGARDEHDMQRFLEAHPRMLIQHLVAGRSAWIIPKKRLGSEHETDFVIVQKASDDFVWHAVELERPQARIFNRNGDPSAALTHALRQISDWRDWLSENRDYAARPRERSGLGLIGIDPELEGLIIIGRDAELDQRATSPRRRRLERTHRIRIETYDWLLSQANERLEILDKRVHPFGDLIRTLLTNPSAEKPAKKAVTEVFGGTCTTWANASLVRRDIEWEGVDIWSDPDFGNYVTAPLQIVYAQGVPEGKLMDARDWKDWIDHVRRDLEAQHSLLVSEIAPAGSLQEILIFEKDGVWYASDRVESQGVAELSQIHILVYLPPAISNDEKKHRIAITQELFQRSIPDPAVEREKELERRERS